MRRIRLPLFPGPLRWFLVAVVASVLLYFSLVAATPIPPKPTPFWDKKLHFAGYAALTLSLAYATATSDPTPIRRILLVLSLALSFGVAVELLQAPLPNRYFSYADMLANAVGALLASAWFLIEPRLEYVPIPDRVRTAD